MDPVTLETDRLLLRAFTPADVDAVYEACQDEDIQFYTRAMLRTCGSAPLEDARRAYLPE
jgi:RimJ/RimL family protein N-acetyltransferase